jgi:hypothetical protein
MEQIAAFNRWKLLIPAIVVIGWGYIIFWPNNHPELFPIVAGCYRNATGVNKVIVKISRNGEFSYGALHTHITITEDKVGYSFLPKQKIVVNPNVTGAIAIDHGYPFLLRISADYQSFAVPDENGPDMTFIKTRC